VPGYKRHNKTAPDYEGADRTEQLVLYPTQQKLM